ncbi:MAG TPA: hypothetical protein VFB81_14310, partial [Myxococcales bacterium]|nr:hypothetical protein [Myxococcales bacterium]
MSAVGQVNDAFLRGQVQSTGQVGGATQPRVNDPAQKPGSGQSPQDLFNRDRFDSGSSSANLRAQQAKFLQPHLLQQPAAAQQAQKAQQVTEAQKAAETQKPQSATQAQEAQRAQQVTEAQKAAEAQK